MAGFIKEIVQALQRSRHTFWAGRFPPRGDMVASTAIYDAAAGFRESPQHHQLFDLAFLVEVDLGSFKQWRRILDEGLRMLSPGGTIVLRFRENRILNLASVANLIFRWTGQRARRIASTSAGPDVIYVCELLTEERRATSAGEWSFGLIGAAGDADLVEVSLRGISVAADAAGVKPEILVAGPGGLASALAGQWSALSFIDTDQGQAAAPPEALLMEAACRENLLMMPAGTVPPADFVASMARFGGDFSVLVPQQTTSDGVVLPSWTSTADRLDLSWRGWLGPDDDHPLAYAAGNIVMGKTAILRRVGWNPCAEPGEAAYLEMARRLEDAGVVTRTVRDVVLVRPSDAGLLAGAERVPFARGIYPNPDRVVAGERPVWSLAAPISADVHCDLRDPGVHPTDRGVILADGWRRTTSGWYWQSAHHAEIGLVFAAGAGRRTITLEFADAAGIRPLVNGQPLADDRLQRLEGVLELRLDDLPAADTAMVHLHLIRAEADRPLTLRRIAVTGVRQVANIAIGAPFKPESVGPMLASGWHEAESWGAWANSSRSHLHLAFPEHQHAALVLTIGLQMAHLGADEVACVLVECAGAAAQKVVFKAGAERRHVTLVVPASRIVEGHAVIALTGDRVVAADPLGRTSDWRFIGVGIFDMRVDVSADRPAADEPFVDLPDLRDAAVPFPASFSAGSFDLAASIGVSPIRSGASLHVPSGWIPTAEGIIWADLGDATLAVNAGARRGGVLGFNFGGAIAGPLRLTLNGRATTVRRALTGGFEVTIKASDLGDGCSVSVKLPSELYRHPLRRVTFKSFGAAEVDYFGRAVQITRETDPFILDEGWHLPEPWGVWSSATVARLRLPVQQARSRHARCRLDLRALVAEHHAPLIVELAIGGAIVGQARFPAGTTDQSVIGNIPPDAIADGLLLVDLRSSHTIDPRTVGIPDGRTLGCALLSFLLDEQPR